MIFIRRGDLEWKQAGLLEGAFLVVIDFQIDEFRRVKDLRVFE